MWTLGEDQPVQCVIIQKMIDSIQRENHFDFHQSSDYVMHSYENHVSNSASALWENRNFSTSLWTFRKNFIDDFFFFWNVANLLSFNFNKVEHWEAVFAIHWYIYILLPFFPVFSNWRDNKQNFLLCFAGAGAKKAIPRVTFIRWATALPHGTVGSLRPAFAPARLVGLAVKPPFAFTLNVWFPSRLRGPLRASVTFYEAFAPNKLPTWNCQVSWFKDHH